MLISYIIVRRPEQEVFLRKEFALSDLMQEIKEELGQERLLKLWKNYGKLIIATIVLFICGVAGKTYWQYHTSYAYQSEGDNLYQAIGLDAIGRSEEAYAQYHTLFEQGHSQYSAIAGLKLAKHYLDEGKEEEAFQLYQALYENKSIPKEYRDLAGLIYASKLSPEKHQEFTGLVEHLSEEGRPWRLSALELGALKEMRQQNTDKAKEYLTRILTTPSDNGKTHQRAREILAAIENQSKVN